MAPSLLNTLKMSTPMLSRLLANRMFFENFRSTDPKTFAEEVAGVQQVDRCCVDAGRGAAVVELWCRSRLRAVGFPERRRVFDDRQVGRPFDPRAGTGRLCSISTSTHGNRIAGIGAHVRLEWPVGPAAAADGTAGSRTAAVIVPHASLHGRRIDVRVAGVADRTTGAGAAREAQPAARAEDEVRIDAVPGVVQVLADDRDVAAAIRQRALRPSGC